MAGTGATPASCRSLMILSQLNEFRKHGRYCDVKLIVAEKEFQAHRNVLATAIPYFQTIFGGNFAEGQQLPCSITIEQFDGPTIEAILSFLYTNEQVVTWENVEQLLGAATYFQIAPLVKDCIRLIKESMNADNCIGIYFIADTYQLTKLKTEVREYMARNFEEVSKKLEFLQADESFVIDLISDDLLNVETEDDVLVAVFRWIQFEKERAKIATEVLKHVRLVLVNPVLLFDTFSTADACKSSSCQDLLTVVKQYYFVPSRRIEMFSELSRRRKTSPDVEVMWVESAGSYQWCITEDGIMETSSQCTLPSIPGQPYGTPFRKTFICNYESLHVETRRLSENEASGGASYYSSKMAAYRTIADFRISKDCGVCELDGRWYFCGGRTDNARRVSDSARCYDTKRETWNVVANLPVAVRSPAVVTVEGRIYVIGGNDTRIAFGQQIQRYYPHTNTWTLMAALPRTARSEISACVMKGLIYVIFRYTREVHVYSVAENEWQETSSLFNHKFLSGPVILNGEMYALTSSDYQKHYLEVFLPSSTSWRVYADFRNLRPDNIKGPLLFKRDTKETGEKKVMVDLWT